MAIFIYVRSQKVFNPYLWLSTCSRSSGFLWDRTCLRVGSAWWDPGCPVFCNMFPSCGCCEGSVLSLFTGSVCITWCSLGDNILVGDNANRYHLWGLSSCVNYPQRLVKWYCQLQREKFLSVLNITFLNFSVSNMYNCSCSYLVQLEPWKNTNSLSFWDVEPLVSS